MASAVATIGLVAFFSVHLWMGPPQATPRDGPLLTMAAQAAGRPKECAPSKAGSTEQGHIGLWESARQPYLRRYCDLLGRAYTKLESAPAAARDAAQLADQVFPGHAAPWLLRARADVLLGDYTQASQEFERARELDPHSIEEPQALRDYATALRHIGKRSEALGIYRLLVPRLQLIPSIEGRIAVLLEAASLASTQGEAGLSEATAFLSEARRMPLSKYDPDLLAYLALTLDRAGMTEQSAAVLHRFSQQGLELSLMSRPAESFEYLTDPSEAFALSAIALERSYPDKAAVLWDRYLARVQSGPFSAHAQRHRQSLSGARASAGKDRASKAAPLRR